MGTSSCELNHSSRLDIMNEKNTEKNTTAPQSGCSLPASGCSTERRSFCKAVVAGGLGAVAIAPPVASGVRMVLSAPEQKGAAGKFYPLATVDSLGQTPQKFMIIDDIRDAWINSSQQRIGSVFLSKNDEGEIRAIHTLCPHAACTIETAEKINPQTGEKEAMFYCACHTAHFDWNGVRLDDTSPSPRDLDTLEVQIEPDGRVLVKFENFITGIPEKKPTG